LLARAGGRAVRPHWHIASFCQWRPTARRPAGQQRRCGRGERNIIPREERPRFLPDVPRPAPPALPVEGQDASEPPRIQPRESDAPVIDTDTWIRAIPHPTAQIPDLAPSFRASACDRDHPGATPRSESGGEKSRDFSRSQTRFEMTFIAHRPFRARARRSARSHFLRDLVSLWLVGSFARRIRSRRYVRARPIRADASAFRFGSPVPATRVNSDWLRGDVRAQRTGYAAIHTRSLTTGTQTLIENRRRRSVER